MTPQHSSLARRLQPYKTAACSDLNKSLGLRAPSALTKEVQLHHPNFPAWAKLKIGNVRTGDQENEQTRRLQ